MIKGTHTKRHLAAVKHLMQYMKDENEEIMRVYYRTRLFEGQTVFDKSKYMYWIKFWWQVFKENLNTCYFFINLGKEAKKKKDKICKIAEKSKGDWELFRQMLFCSQITKRALQFTKNRRNATMAKKNYENLAKEIVRYIGGVENVNTLIHCATRLRFI